MDGTLEDRVYYCQNAGGWRADVAGLTNASGEQIETAKYSSYGTPFCLPAGDVDADGDNSGDYTQIAAWVTAMTYKEHADRNLDGVLNAADTALAFAKDGALGGRGVVSTLAVGNRKGYAGYEGDGAITRCAHVRHRIMDFELGRWTRRDPAGYIDGLSLGAYVRGAPIGRRDPTGLLLACCERLGRAFGDTGPDWPNPGLTFCCHGQLVRCNYMRLHPEWYPDVTDGRDAIADCVDAHEGMHVKNGRCEDGQGPASNPRQVLPIGDNCEECVACGRELACLAAKLLTCSSPACNADVGRRIIDVGSSMAEACGKCVGIAAAAADSSRVDRLSDIR